MCVNISKHLLMMVAMSIYVKKPLKNLLQNQINPMTLKLGMLHWVLEYYQVCSNDEPVLIYFTTRSNLLSYPFI